MEDKEESEQALFDKLTMNPLDYNIYAFIKKDMKFVLALQEAIKKEKESE